MCLLTTMVKTMTEAKEGVRGCREMDGQGDEGCAADRWRSPGTWSALLTMVLLIVLTYIPVTECEVLCNEFDTCFPVQQQFNVTVAIQEGNKRLVCDVATTAVECLKEAREDCDNGYDNLPSIIIQGLEDKRQNVTAYQASYCGTNGSVGHGGSVAAMLVWTLLTACWLSI